MQRGERADKQQQSLVPQLHHQAVCHHVCKAPASHNQPTTHFPPFCCCAAGQWVAWKKLGDKAAAGGDLFVANSFYNLLCPQRPSTL